MAELSTLGAVIKAAYEGEANTNALTDAEKTKLGHISVTQAVDLDAMEASVASAVQPGENVSILVNDSGFLASVDIADINATGTPGSGNFLRGDGTWEAPAGGSGDFKADGSVDMTGEFRTDVGTFDSDVADGASAVAFNHDTANAFTTAGAKLAQWKNNGTGKFSIDKDGLLVGSATGYAYPSAIANSWGFGTSTKIRGAIGGTNSGHGIWTTQVGVIGFDNDGNDNIAGTSPSDIDAGFARQAANVVRVIDGTSKNPAALQLSFLQATTSYTVATLPGTPVVGMLARVTDADTPAIGSTVVGGGAAAALVWYNGANWTVIGL